MLIALGLVVIYVVFVWLVFFRFKLMKFTSNYPPPVGAGFKLRVFGGFG